MRSQNELRLPTLTHYRRILVNLAATLQNTLNLDGICRLMIVGKSQNFLAT